MHSLLMLAHLSSFIVLLDLYDTRINEAESPQVVMEFAVILRYRKDI